MQIAALSPSCCVRRRHSHRQRRCTGTRCLRRPLPDRCRLKHGNLPDQSTKRPQVRHVCCHVWFLHVQNPYMRAEDCMGNSTSERSPHHCCSNLDECGCSDCIHCRLTPRPARVAGQKARIRMEPATSPVFEDAICPSWCRSRACDRLHYPPVLFSRQSHLISYAMDTARRDHLSFSLQHHNPSRTLLSCIAATLAEQGRLRNRQHEIERDHCDSPGLLLHSYCWVSRRDKLGSASTSI